MTDPTSAPDRPPLDLDANFGGHPGRECGEHRTTGARAWCHDCSEWCTSDAPCARCELPKLRAELDAARASYPRVRWGDVGAAFHSREPLMPQAARAERTEPATDLDATAGNARVVFWMCPVKGHSDSRKSVDGWPVVTVEWRNGIAYCKFPGCDETSAARADRPPLDLDAIRAATAARDFDVVGAYRTINLLIAEVTALRAELDAARAELRTNEDSEDARLAIAVASLEAVRADNERLREQIGLPSGGMNPTSVNAAARAELVYARTERKLDPAVRQQLETALARAERTEPAAGDLGAFEDVALSVTGKVNTLRTEPATGEDDVNAVADILDEWWQTADGSAVQVAQEILAALDPPGREQALREEIELWRKKYEREDRAHTTALMAHADQLDKAREILATAEYSRDQYRMESERLGDKANQLVGLITFEKERANEAARLSAEARDRADDLRKQIADLHDQIAIVEEGRTEITVELDRVTSALDDLKQANDALHDARDNTAELLKEARTERDEVSHELSLMRDTCDEWRQHAEEARAQLEELRASAIEAGERDA